MNRYKITIQEMPEGREYVGITVYEQTVTADESLISEVVEVILNNKKETK